MTAPHHRYLATCEATGKRQYTDRATAKTVAREMKGKGLTTYRCDDCGHWHIGHRSIYSRAEHREHHNAIRGEVNP